MSKHKYFLLAGSGLFPGHRRGWRGVSRQLCELYGALADRVVAYFWLQQRGLDERVGRGVRGALAQAGISEASCSMIW